MDVVECDYHQYGPHDISWCPEEICRVDQKTSYIQPLEFQYKRYHQNR